MPNFAFLDPSRPEIATLMAAMLQARDAVSRRSWSHPQDASSDDWWADVLADPRARRRERRTDMAANATTMYRLRDEPRAVVLVACLKCEWRAAFELGDLIAAHGADCPMPSLLDKLAAPGCRKIGRQWDRCGVHYVEPIEAQMKDPEQQ
jgi:hypothetical protein